jgi:hypothetical protein
MPKITDHLRSFLPTIADEEADRHRYAYMPGTKDPNGWGPGKITSERIYQNEGSQTPIPHDRDGNPVEVEGGGEMKIPGYEWHDKSPEFHRMAKRVASRHLKSRL